MTHLTKLRVRVRVRDRIRVRAAFGLGTLTHLTRMYFLTAGVTTCSAE